MRTIPVKEIEDGMVAAAEVLDRRGGVLLNPGDSLRKSYITKLIGWGVHEVEIEGEDPATDAPDKKPEEDMRLPREMETRIISKITHRFEMVGDDLLMKRLERLSRKHVLHRAASKYALK